MDSFAAIPLTQTLSPSGDEGDQGGRPCAVSQTNLPQKATRGEVKKGLRHCFVRILAPMPVGAEDTKEAAPVLSRKNPLQKGGQGRRAADMLDTPD